MWELKKVYILFKTFQLKVDNLSEHFSSYKIKPYYHVKPTRTIRCKPLNKRACLWPDLSNLKVKNKSFSNVSVH